MKLKCPKCDKPSCIVTTKGKLEAAYGSRVKLVGAISPAVLVAVINALGKILGDIAKSILDKRADDSKKVIVCENCGFYEVMK